MLKWIGAIPWVALLVGMPLVNHVKPFVLGLPLPLFWSIVCAFLAAGALAIVYSLDPANRVADDAEPRA